MQLTQWFQPQEATIISFTKSWSTVILKVTVKIIFCLLHNHYLYADCVHVALRLGLSCNSCSSSVATSNQVILIIIIVHIAVIISSIILTTSLRKCPHRPHHDKYVSVIVINVNCTKMSFCRPGGNTGSGQIPAGALLQILYQSQIHIKTKNKS